jgi:hypothetical protein
MKRILNRLFSVLTLLCLAPATAGAQAGATGQIGGTAFS